MNVKDIAMAHELAEQMHYEMFGSDPQYELDKLSEVDRDILLSKMAQAMHDGPLGADDHWFSASTKQGGWCVDMARAALEVAETILVPASAIAEARREERRQIIRAFEADRRIKLSQAKRCGEGDGGQLMLLHEDASIARHAINFIRALPDPQDTKETTDG